MKLQLNKEHTYSVEIIHMITNKKEFIAIIEDNLTIVDGYMYIIYERYDDILVSKCILTSKTCTLTQFIPSDIDINDNTLLY